MPTKEEIVQNITAEAPTIGSEMQQAGVKGGEEVNANMATRAQAPTPQVGRQTERPAGMAV